MDIENKENYFPWMEEIVHSFAKYFMTDYDIDILSFLHSNIDEEIHLISSSRGYTVTRSKALYKELTHIYEHMRLKMIQHSDLPNTTLSCVKLLSQLIRIGLILTQGLTNSEWIERIMTAIKLFSGNKDSIYDALLLVNGLKKIHHKPYALILKCILEDHHDHATDPLVYMEIILLYRRLKALLPIKNRDQCNISATKIKPPINLISWLKSLDVEESFHLPKNLQYKKVALHLMRKNISESLLKNLRDMVLNRYCFEDNSNKFKSRNKENQPLDMFIIDTSSKKEDAAEIKVNSLKNTNSKPRRKRKKPESLPNNDIEVIVNEDINNEVLFINPYSNSMVEDEVQLAQKKQNNTCISESNVEIGILSTTCLESNEHKMSTKKKKKKAKNHRKQAKNNESGSASLKSEPDSESAFSQSDMLLKKSKQICESVTVACLSPKRSISDDTDNSKFILEKESNTKSVKKLKLLSNSKESSEYNYDEISKKSADMTPLHILMDKNKMCMVDFQNNLSSNNNVDDVTNSNRSYENISSTKDQYSSPSPSEKLNNDNEINNNKNVYFKKLMLRKITSETKALCEQDQTTDGKISNLNILSKETSVPINEVPSNSSSNTVIGNYGKDPKLVKQQSDNNNKAVSRNTVISNSPLENKECLNNISQDVCSSVNAVDSENLETNKDINQNNTPNSIKEKNVLCKDSRSPLVLESLSPKQLDNESIKDTDYNGKKLSDSSTSELTPGSVPSDNLHSPKKILHLDCTVSSPEEKGWDRMKVCVDGFKSKIKIDIDIGMNMGSFTYKNDSKSTHTHISNVEQKISGSTIEDATVKETITSSENSTVCELSNLKLKLPEESSIESHATVTDTSSEKEPCDKSKSKELSNLDSKLLIECSSETNTLKTQGSSEDGSTLESKSTLLHDLDNKLPSEPSNKDKSEKNEISSNSSSVSQSHSFPLIGLEHEHPSGFSSNDLTNNDKTSVSPSSNTLSESKSVELSYFRYELPLKFSQKDAIDTNKTSDLESEIPAKLPSENNTNEVEILSEDGDVSQSKSPQLSSIADGELAADCSNKGEIEKTLMTSITKQGQLPDSEHKSVCVDKNSRSETCVSLEEDSKSNAHLEESQSKDVSNVDFDHLKVCSEDNKLLKETQISSEDDFATDNKKSHTASDSFNVCETTDKICLFDNSVVLEHASSSNDLNKNPEEDVDFITSKSLESETEVVSYLSAEIADQATNEPQTHGKSVLESKAEEKLENKTENIENSEEKTKIFAASETHSLTKETSGSAVHTNEHSHGVFENSESQLIKSQNVDVEATVNVNDETRLSVTNPITSSVVKSVQLDDTVNDAENLIKVAGKPDEQSIELQNNIKETPVSAVHTNEHSHGVFENSESQLIKSQNVDVEATVNVNDETRLSVTNPVTSSVLKSVELNDTVNNAENLIKVAGKPDEQSNEWQNNIKETPVSAVHTNEHSHGVFENSESQLIKSQNVDVEATVNVNDETRLSVINPVTSSVVKSVELDDTVNDAENLIKVAGKPDEQSIELQNNIKETPVSAVHTNEHSHGVFENSESQLIKSQNVDVEATVNVNDETRLSVTNPVISSVVKSEDLNDTVKDANNSIKVAGKPDEQSIESQNNIKQTVNVDSNLDHSTENSNSLQNSTNIQLSNKSTEVLNENSFTEKITDWNLQDLTDKASSVENSHNCNTCSTSKLCFCNKENLSNDVTSERVTTKSLVKSDSKGQYDNESEIKDSVTSSTSKFGEINFSCPSSLTNNDCKQVQNNYLKAGTISDGTSKSFSLSEKQNEFKTFSDISQKNKDKSINVDSGLKDTSPITKFSSAASTELFSMYRNVMLHDENYKIPSPRGVTPEKGDVFLITDDIKSYSSDHSDNDSDSKHCSEEMEALGEDVKVTSENSSSLEIDDSSLSKKSDIFADKKENEVIDENEASYPPVDVSDSLDNTEGKDTFEKEVKLLPRQSLRLQNKVESQNKNSSDENSGTDTSKPEKISPQCCDIILDDKHSFEIDYSGPDSKTSHSTSQNARELPCTSNSKKSAVDHQPVIKKSLSNAKNILKDKRKDCKTPSNSYSLRKSSRRKDNSANLGIDLNKLVIDSPTSSKDSSSRKVSKYVKWLTSEYESKTEDSDSKHSVIRETRSSTVQSEKEAKEDPPSYNLRNRKSTLRPARLKI